MASRVGLVAAHDLFLCLQAVVLSDDANSAMKSAVVAILMEYNTSLESGDADDVATLESVATAIGSALELSLSSCE